jgi:hypothetical protein
MALPDGLLPVFVFIVTVGVSVSTVLVAAVRSRAGAGPFDAVLRTALLATSTLYLVGTAAVWVVFGTPWTVPATLVVAGVATLVVSVTLPLAVGRALIRRTRGVDAETALRFATHGWPIAMLVAFGVFVAPGGIGGDHLLDLEGTQICLAGFCGIAVSLLAAVLFEVAVVLVGPGAVGAVVHAVTARRRETRR